MDREASRAADACGIGGQGSDVAAARDVPGQLRAADRSLAPRSDSIAAKTA